MSDNAGRTFIQKLDGTTHQVLIQDGEIIELLDDVKPCRAKQNDLKCCLDAVHKMLGTSHLHRHIDGRLESFKQEKVCADQPHEKVSTADSTATAHGEIK